MLCSFTTQYYITTQYCTEHNIVLQHKIWEFFGRSFWHRNLKGLAICSNATGYCTMCTATFSTKSFIFATQCRRLLCHIKIKYNVFPIQLSIGLPNESMLCSLWYQLWIFIRTVVSLCTPKGCYALYEHFMLPPRLCHWCKKSKEWEYFLVALHSHQIS